LKLRKPAHSPGSANPRTLAIEIGGAGLKALLLAGTATEGRDRRPAAV
jgi:hypothetical protein